MRGYSPPLARLSSEIPKVDPAELADEIRPENASRDVEGAAEIGVVETSNEKRVVTVEKTSAAGFLT